MWYMSALPSTGAAYLSSGALLEWLNACGTCYPGVPFGITGQHHMMHERTTSDRAARLRCRGRYAVIGCWLFRLRLTVEYFWLGRLLVVTREVSSMTKEAFASIVNMLKYVLKLVSNCVSCAAASCEQLCMQCLLCCFLLSAYLNKRVCTHYTRICS